MPGLPRVAVLAVRRLQTLSHSREGVAASIPFWEGRDVGVPHGGFESGVGVGGRGWTLS